jgi:hypothetical protein
MLYIYRNKSNFILVYKMICHTTHLYYVKYVTRSFLELYV